MIQVLSSPSEVRARSFQARAEGKAVALVPTMGSLHDGHLELMREGKRRGALVIVSLFVNPTQFGPKEDFSRYPRDLGGDRKKCESVGVDVLFTPTVETMYPRGFQTFVEVTDVSQGLCGEKRPGHFRGVATVVAKLFNIVQPDVAFFGEKDYQQLAVIRTLSRDLNLGIDVVGLPTIREADDLAMSSRNAYLSPAEREQALSLSRGLRAAQKACLGGERDAEKLEGLVRGQLQAAGVREDYVSLVDAETLRAIDVVEPKTPARLLVAGFVGQTRLIDNVGVETR